MGGVSFVGKGEGRKGRGSRKGGEVRKGRGVEKGRGDGRKGREGWGGATDI